MVSINGQKAENWEVFSHFILSFQRRFIHLFDGLLSADSNSSIVRYSGPTFTRIITNVGLFVLNKKVLISEKRD